MIYKIGTMNELKRVGNRFPLDVRNDLVHYIAILDDEYGEDRDYFVQGGYCVVAETEDDVEKIKEIIDYDTQLLEFATYSGESKEYVTALYLLGDDFGIVLFIPSGIAPRKIVSQITD